MTKIEGKTFLSGQRFRIAFPKCGTLMPLALTDSEFKIAFRSGAGQTLTLQPEGLTLEMVAGAVELVKDKSTRGETIGYYAACTACHAESKRQKVQSPRLESWANAHRCGRDMVLAPDARKKGKK
jgi:hypothetical protein